MMTRELGQMTEPEYGSWLGIDPEAQPRPDVARGAGAHVTPSARLMIGTGLGMDPTDPTTYSRPYNPARGMFGRLHEDQARANQRRQ